MQGGDVALAALGILGGAIAVLTYIIREQFKQSVTTFKEFKEFFAEFRESFAKDDLDRREFQKIVIQTLQKNTEVLSKISEKQDTIHDTLNATNMTVKNLYVMHEQIDCRKPKGGKHVATAKKS